MSGRVESGYPARLALLHASGELGVVDNPKAYFFCLIQRMTGLTPHEVGKLQARLKAELKPEQVAQAEKDAYDWWEDRNKPARPVVVAGTKGEGNSEMIPRTVVPSTRRKRPRTWRPRTAKRASVASSHWARRVNMSSRAPMTSRSERSKPRVLPR